MQQRFQEEAQTVMTQPVAAQVSELKARPALVPVAKRVLARVRREQRRNAVCGKARYASLFAAVYGSVFVWLMILLFKLHSSNLFLILAPILLAVIGGVVGGWRLRRAELLQPTFSAGGLRRIGGPEAVAPLLQLLDSPETGKDQESVLAAVTLLLPQISGDDADLLNDSDCAFLYSELAAMEQRKTTDPEREDFTLAILTWVAQTGEVPARPYVERLADMEARYPAQQRVRDAARECLRRLQGSTISSSARVSPPLTVDAPQQAAEIALRPASLDQDTPAVISEQPETMVSAAFIAQFQERARRTQRRMLAFCCVSAVCVAAILLGIYMRGIGVWSLLMTIVMGLFALQLSTQKQPYSSDVLVGQGGKQIVGLLIEQLGVSSNLSEGRALVGALTTLLPQLNASDAHLLNERQRECLYRLLRGTTTFKVTLRHVADFRLSVLKALEQIGDAKAIPVVERIANMRVKTPEQTEIRDAARNCLPLLRANAGNIASDLTLLRASANAEVDTETLLRAAAATSSTAPEQLLRGTAANDDMTSAA
jgi:hypothetical protein